MQTPEQSLMESRHRYESVRELSDGITVHSPLVESSEEPLLKAPLEIRLRQHHNDSRGKKHGLMWTATSMPNAPHSLRSSGFFQTQIFLNRVALLTTFLAAAD
jgi:hypothetical protein